MKRILIGLAAALALCACASSATYAPGPALFVARDADSTLYIYGTIHLRKPGQPWGSAAVDAALASADEIWTEIEISPESTARTQALTLQAGMAPAGQPLSSWLSPEENAQLQAAAQRLGLPAQALEPLRPWLASLMFSMYPMIQAGYDPNAGVDTAIDRFGDSNGKTMRSFETVDQQIGFFANLSPDLQRQMLLEAIAEAGKGAEMLDQMSTAWEAGDLDALDRLLSEDMREEYPEIYEVMIRRRNTAWVGVLVSEMEGAGVDFVAVGAAHLVGTDGVVTQLRARGVRIERVRAD
jgi:uncharacterized protein